MSDEIFLKLEGIRKSFGGVHALQGVDLEIRKGEVHCLAGENGCGKSTLIKAISGVHEPDEGKIWIDGEEVKNMKPMDAINRGIQVIYQDFAVFPNLSVAENIALNGELKSKAKFVNWKSVRKIALEAMDQIGANIDPDIKLERLSVANKQMVAICRAIINDAKLLILDEPTTALTAREVEKLWDIIRSLKAKGIAIMIVNHKLDEIYQIADRLTILRNGKYISSGDIHAYDQVRFTQDMTGHDVVETKYSPAQSNEEVLRVENLGRKGAFSGVSFTLNKGDVLGITGLLGSGRGEIGEALFGLAPADEGEIYLNGKKIEIGSVNDAMKNEIGYVPEDRLTQGLFMERSILDNTIAASIKKYMKRGKLDGAGMEGDTERWVKEIGIKTPSIKPPVRTLSGGNAQKVVIAKWLNTHPKLFILDGPTVGVDVGAKSEIHAILHDLANKGIGIIIISDDLVELVKNCNKIVIMKDGKCSGIIDNSIDEVSLGKLLIGAGGEANE
ncbi:MAG: sugar ABC transporter ATP-binding protein [Lachnospiraceae bacterium]|nr:sugar ABC transporter ATP-binding protein [Lachnospiraceae bacterium]